MIKRLKFVYTPFWSKCFDFLLANNCPLFQRLENHRLHVKYKCNKNDNDFKASIKKLELIKKVHFKNAYHSKNCYWGFWNFQRFSHCMHIALYISVIIYICIIFPQKRNSSGRTIHDFDNSPWNDQKVNWSAVKMDRCGNMTWSVTV